MADVAPPSTRAAHSVARLTRLLAAAPPLLAALRAPLLPAQPAPPMAGGEYAIEQQVRDRWMHGRQQPRFTPFAESRSWLIVDSLRTGDGGERRIYLTLGRSAYGRDSALVVRGPDGRVTRLEATARPAPRTPFTTPDDSARWVRLRLFINGRLALPAARLWDLAPTFRAAPLRPGARWTDTLARAAEQDGNRQALRGVRVSTLVGDTTVDGRRLWVVRDSARVRYEERWLEEERTLDTLVVVERTADGVIRGRHLYDPDLGLFRARSDTTTLAGAAVLRYPDGRTFRTPARYERVRRWDLYDPSGYAARQTALRAERERERGGMVITPTTNLERRLAAGDTALRDSLLAEWQRSSDPDRDARFLRPLSWWRDRDRRLAARIDSLRVSAGDTAHLYRLLWRRAFSTVERPDTADVRVMLAFMEDPGLAFALNESRDVLYENLRQALTTWPPAVTRDTSRWPCTPAACRLLAEQWRVAREQRLREVGLVALVALDPPRWSDTVLARARPSSHLLWPAAMLARGVGATWPAASKQPMPQPGADWRGWLEWMSGTDPRYEAARAARPVAAAMAEQRIRFDESHATAIRFFQARTGRDVVGELRRAYAGAQTDSARLVFGAMLQGLGELRLSPDDVVTHFRSGSPERIALARRALTELFRGPALPADSATALPVLDRLIALVAEGVPAWRSLGGGPALSVREGPELHQAPRRRAVFFLADSMPAALRAKWKERITVITADEWRRRPLREAGVLYTLSPVRRVGPFVQVGVSADERLARGPDQAPALYASGTRYYLMELNGEWVVVASEGRVT